jgi:hypothetical protein
VHAKPSHWVYEFFISKTLGHHFQPGLIPLPMKVGILRKKKEALSLHNTTFHWLHGNSISKIGCHYFWPGPISLLKNTLPILAFISLNHIQQRVLIVFTTLKRPFDLAFVFPSF